MTGTTPTGEPYRSCFECGHAFHTKRDLRYAYRWEGYLGPLTFLALLLTPARSIHFCPLCMHDFLPRRTTPAQP